MKKLSVIFLLGLFVGALHMPMTMNAGFWSRLKRKVAVEGTRSESKGYGLYESIFVPEGAKMRELEAGAIISQRICRPGIPATALFFSIKAFSFLIRGKEAPFSTFMSASLWSIALTDLIMLNS